MEQSLSNRAVADRDPAAAKVTRSWVATTRVAAVAAVALAIAGVVKSTGGGGSGFQILVLVLAVGLLGLAGLGAGDGRAARAAARGERAPIAPHLAWLRTVRLAAIAAVALAVIGAVRSRQGGGSGFQILVLVLAVVLLAVSRLGAPSLRRAPQAAAAAGPVGQHVSWLRTVRLASFGAFALALISLIRSTSTDVLAPAMVVLTAWVMSIAIRFDTASRAAIAAGRES